MEETIRTRKYAYVYKITNLVNNKIYVGARTTDTNPEDDTYMGSSHILNKAIRKYGRENFKKEVLEIFTDKKDAFKREQEIVNKEFIARNDTYNITIGGYGSKDWTPKLSKTISEAKMGQKPWNTGKKGCFSEKSKQSISRSLKGKMAGDKNPMFGKNIKDHMTPENYKIMCDRLSIRNSGKIRTEEHKKHYSENASKRRWIVHRSGKLSHLKENDERLLTGDWMLGQKWRDKQ